MRALSMTFVAMLVVGCGDEPGGAASGSAPKASGSAPAKTTASAAMTATATATMTDAPAMSGSAMASGSAAAEAPKVFACDAATVNNACIEWVGKDYKEEDAKKACEAAPWKGKMAADGCPKDGRVGMCTLDAGTPKETVTYVYAKGAKTLDSKAAKAAHCAKGDWADLK
jgi:hypothetical protein